MAHSTNHEVCELPCKHELRCGRTQEALERVEMPFSMDPRGNSTTRHGGDEDPTRSSGDRSPVLTRSSGRKKSLFQLVGGRDPVHRGGEGTVLGAAGHMCPQKGSRGRRIDAGVLAMFLFLCSLGSQPVDWHCSHLEWVFPSQQVYSR